MMKYYAFGSNLLVQRLYERTPSCRPRFPATLPGHQLRFHKRGADGSGKCDAFATGNPHHRMHGAVYELSGADKAVLDKFEGLGRGYHEAEAEVAGPDGPVSVFFYVATASHIDARRRPFSWYKDLVLYGAIQHRLPRHYVEGIRAVAAVPDHDRERHRRHRWLVRAAYGIRG